jgi:hypothetical protein
LFAENWVNLNASSGFDYKHLNGPTPGPYSYFTASCVDLFLYGFERLLRENPTFTVQALANGTYNNRFRVPSSFSFPDLGTPAGKIVLNTVGDRIGDYDVINFEKNGNSQIVGRWSVGSFSSSRAFNYPGDTSVRPKDGIDPNDVADFAQTSDAGGILALLFGSIGILAGLFTTVMYVLKRNSKVIKSASLIISLIQILALTIAYVQFFLMVNKPTQAICSVDSILLAILFSFYYGLVFAKSYRVYNIFCAAGRKAPLRDYHVVAISVACTIPTAIILIVWHSISNPAPYIHQMSPTTFYWTCSSNSAVQSNAYAALLVWNAIVLFANLWVAFKSRSIPSKFYDGKMTALSVYNTTLILMFVLIILGTESLGFRLKLFVKLVGVFYILSFNLGAVFIAKLFSVNYGDKGANSETDTNTSLQKDKDNQKDAQNIAQLKRTDGLSYFFGEMKMVVISTINGDMLVFTPIHKKAVDSTSVVEDSSCMMFNIANVRKFGANTNGLRIQIMMDRFCADLSFETQEAVQKWQQVFQNWKTRVDMRSNGFMTTQGIRSGGPKIHRSSSNG